MPVEIACPSNAVEAVPDLGETDLRPTTLAVCAIGCGLSVANIYYAQPLLDAMAHDFEIPPAAIGLVVTLTQIGYALGLILVVPLGDLIDPRKLAVAQAASSAVALTIVAASQSAAVMFPAMVMVGLLSVIVQVLVAYAAALAEPARRGQAIGTVTSGIVMGILSARVVAGLLSDLGGWRAVYMVSACLSAVLALALAHLLPRRGSASFAGSYFAVVRSIPRLFVEDPVLRLRGMLALLIFATFSTFWTALVLPLSASPFSFSHTQIGLFGLCVLGRDRTTKEWLAWTHAWCHEGVLERRKSIAPRLRDFADAGELTIVGDALEDIAAIVDVVAQVKDAGLLACVGVDPAGLGEFIEALAEIGVTQDAKLLVGVPQGYGMMNAIKTTERKLANGTLRHAGSGLMAWAVSNLKIEPTATAIRATKQNAGDAKIDPVMALFDAVVPMSMNPEPPANANLAGFLADPLFG